MTKAIQQTENNSQTDHLKSLPNKEQENVENKVFDLVLVDIVNSRRENIECVKKNIYDPELKYICISYRWGELSEQLQETPDYTAHITSFHLDDLKILCNRIIQEPDLKDMDYLWIDAISVDQQNHERKKDTILKMNQIYQHASYILAVPDLHLGYLKKNTANRETLYLLDKYYKKKIYKEIFNNKQPNNYTTSDDISSPINTNSTLLSDSTSEQLINNDDRHSFIQKLTNENKGLKMENKELKMENTILKIEMEKNEKEKKKRIYRFLAYLIVDWSNRAWVISECQIAKEKYKKNGTPLKYMFITFLDNKLFYNKLYEQPFFSYHFNEDDDQQSTTKNSELKCEDVEDHILFNQFVKSRFMQRSHLEMILNSNATRNEDRFNAILPSWNKYNHLIKNKNTISDWKIGDMTSVRLKLYEIMDLWDKTTLLLACKDGTILPTFASKYEMKNLKIIEKMNHKNDYYKEFEVVLLRDISTYKGEQEAIKIKQLLDEYKIDSKSMWNENFTSIQLDKHHCYLSVKSKKYIIKNGDSDDKNKYQNKLSLENGDEIHKVFIPFFTSNLPADIYYQFIYFYSSYISLIGNKKKNKWIFYYDNFSKYNSEPFCTDDYSFNIY